MPSVSQNRLSNQRGIVLIIVLVIVGLISALAYALLDTHRLSIARVKHTLELLQAKEYALGGAAFARQILLKDFLDEDNLTRTDSRADIWASSTLQFDIEDGEIQILINDLQGLFNLNSVLTDKGLQQFKNLLTVMQFDLSLADKVRDWIDDNSQVFGLGAEDFNYLSLETPFRAANQLIYSLSELNLVSNLRPEELSSIQQTVTVLPLDKEPILNINTINPMVLHSLEPRISLDLAQTIADSPVIYKTASEAIAEFNQLSTIGAQLVTRSEFFQIQINCRYREQNYSIVSLVHRSLTTGAVKIISRRSSPNIFGSTSPSI